MKGQGISRVSALVVGLLVAVMVFATTTSANPGFKVTITDGGLNYARQIAVQYVERKFATVRLPNQAGEAKAPVIGKIKWELNNIVMSGLSLPQSSISILPGRGVQVSIVNAALRITMDFKFGEKGWPHAGGKGSLGIAGSGIDITVAVQVGEANGRPTLAVISSQCVIGKLDVKEHGGPSWLYNFFLSELNKPIREAAEKAIGPAIANLINDGGNHALQTIPFQEQFGGIAEVDYSLVSGPTFGSNYLTLNSKGEFYYLPQKQEAPFTAQPMPDQVNGQMLQILLSDFVPNSASFAFRQSGKMSATLLDKDLPANSPVRLNTNSWAKIIPVLAQKYPNMAMSVVLTTSAPPTVSFSSAGARVTGPGQIVVNVLSSSAIPVFALNINLETAGSVHVSGGRIYPDVSYINSPFSIAYSNIGSFDVGPLNSIVSALCQEGIVPFFNYYLSHGINIPTIQGVTLVNPNIAYGSGWLAIATDVSYSF